MNVIGGHVSKQGDQHTVVILNGSIQASAGRFNGPAESAPEVEFPGQVEPVIPLAKEPAGDVRAVGDFSANRVARVVTCRVLRLREEIARGDGELGSRLQHPGTGLPQGQILLVGGTDERVEKRILEDRVPCA